MMYLGVFFRAGVDDEPTDPCSKCQESLEMPPGKRGTTVPLGMIASFVRGRDNPTL